MNPDLQTKLENIKSLIDQILSAEGGGEELMKALKAMIPEDEKNNKEDEKEKEKKAKKQENENKENEDKDESEKAKKDIINTPSTGTTVNDNPKEYFEDIPEDVDEAIDEIKKSVLDLTKIIKEMAKQQVSLTKGHAKLLEGMGIVKQLGLDKPDEKVEKAKDNKKYQNSEAIPSVTDSINSLKKTLESQGINFNNVKTLDEAKLARKNQISEAAMRAMMFGK